MDLKDIFSKETLSKITGAAPLIGSLLGPGGAAAGTMIKLIAGNLGVEETPQAVEAAIQNNPDALLKLKELEFTHRIELGKILLERDRLELSDKASARGREVEMTKATGKRDGNLYALAWLGILGYLAIIIYLIGWGLPKMTAEIALMVGNLIGIVGAKYSGIFDYFFGSSKGSADKTAIMATSKGD
jgi:hypothetical protein